MLKFNLIPLFKAREIQHPTKYLTSLGFSSASASHYKHGKTAALSLKNVEILCEALNCTPNDLLEFIPTEKQQKQMPAHPLAGLIRQAKTEELIQQLNALPYSQLIKIAEIIKTI